VAKEWLLAHLNKCEQPFECHH